MTDGKASQPAIEMLHAGWVEAVWQLIPACRTTEN